MADLMTVAKALAFVDELVLLDDDCTRPELAMRVLAAEVRRLQDRESTLQASVMAHKTWEDEAVGQANNANLAYNKMRVERDALKAEVERLTRERAVAIEAAAGGRTMTPDKGNMAEDKTVAQVQLAVDQLTADLRQKLMQMSRGYGVSFNVRAEPILVREVGHREPLCVDYDVRVEAKISPTS